MRSSHSGVTRYGTVFSPGPLAGVLLGVGSVGASNWLSSVKVGVLVLSVASICGGGTMDSGGECCLLMGSKWLGFLRSSLKYAKSALSLSITSPNDVVHSSAVVRMYLGTLMMW